MSTHGPDNTGERLLSALVLLVLAVLSPLSLWLEVLFLPSYWGAVPLPVSAFAAGAVNVAIVFGAESATRHAFGLFMPLILWILGFLYLATPGPGGDLMLLATWQTLLLFILGIVPALSVLGWRIIAIAPTPRRDQPGAAHLPASPESASR